MQTHFTSAQLQDPKLADANTILRKCVHCGFCTATCPTYVLLGDELDSPRGRITLMQDMLETGGKPSKDVVKHVDRCLSCLSCMTTCPSGVNYMHLVDTARAYIEDHHTRPLPERVLRNLLAYIMPRPDVFAWGMKAARLAKPFAGRLTSLGFKRLAAALALVPSRLPKPEKLGPPGTYAAQGERRGRIGLLRGCVQSVVDPGINAAAIRLLTRMGFDVVVAGGESCCGSLTHHMGKEDDALARARRSIDQWSALDLDYVVVTASGCGTTIKDYGHMFKNDGAHAASAALISAKTLDIAEFLALLEPPKLDGQNIRVAYHSACSLQHGQKVTQAPVALLRQAGFEVLPVAEAHLCCGSAGTYNILQPEIASQLKARKQANIAATQAHVVVAGNLGCITQLQQGLGRPMLHTVELLDWAYGGPMPQALKDLKT
jgi:glycolate oxidase iron-sulfur subunit